MTMGFLISFVFDINSTTNSSYLYSSCRSTNVINLLVGSSILSHQARPTPLCRLFWSQHKLLLFAPEAFQRKKLQESINGNMLTSLWSKASTLYNFCVLSQARNISSSDTLAVWCFSHYLLSSELQNLFWYWPRPKELFENHLKMLSNSNGLFTDRHFLQSFSLIPKCFHYSARDRCVLDKHQSDLR